MSDTALPIPAERIERAILLLRGHKVMLDADLAVLYGVTTKRLNEQVKRNTDRFPLDFMFQLTSDEWQGLRSQFATTKGGRGGRRTPPYAFTEHGTVMLANVLNNPVAIQASIHVVRAFIRLRQGNVPTTAGELNARLGRHRRGTILARALVAKGALVQVAEDRFQVIELWNQLPAEAFEDDGPPEVWSRTETRPYRRRPREEAPT